MNKVLYNLEKKTVDSIGRTKTTRHVGVFDSEEKLEQAKANILASEPNVRFEVHICEHLFLKSESD